MVHLSVIPS